MTRSKRLFAALLSVLVLLASMPVMAISAIGGEYEISTSEPYNMQIGPGGETVRFTPEEDGWYTFYTTGHYDTYATLFHADYETLDFADDTDEDRNFELKVKLYSGYTYYLEVQAYGVGEGETISFDLYVVETAGVKSVTVTKEPDRTTVIEGYEYESCSCEGMELEFTLSDDSTVAWSYDDGGDVAGSPVDISLNDDGNGNLYVDITCDEAEGRYFFETIENPIDYLEYLGTPFAFYEGTGGYYDEYEGYYHYDYGFADDTEVTVYYKDGTSETIHYYDSIMGSHINISDDQENTHWGVGSNNFIKLSLLGVTAEVPVTIHAVPFANVTIDSAPTRDYVFGDIEFGEMDGDTYKFKLEDLTGLIFTVEYLDGTKETYTDADIDMENKMIDGYMYTLTAVACTTTGTYEAILNYKGYDIRFNVDVVDSPIADIEVTKSPDRVDYEDDYYPLLYGMEVKVTYTDGTSETVTLTEENIEYFLDGELVYAVKGGKNTLYIRDRYDYDMETFYSSITCLAKEAEYYGINYSVTREVVSITAEKMSANGDGAVLHVEYENGDKETLTFANIGLYDYGFGDYEGYAKTDNGILYYSVYADHDGGEVVGYDCYTLGFDFYVDKATVSEPLAKIAGYSLSLTDNISVNFFLKLSDAVVADENAKVVFTYADTTFEVAVADGVYDEATGTYKFACKVPAKDMATDINCQVVSGNEESDIFTQSVKGYAEVILADPVTYAKEQALVKAMLNYGAAAQTYFGYNTDNLANDTEHMTDDDRMIVPIDFTNFDYTLSGEEAGVTYYGTALSLKSELAIKHYFIIDEGVDVDALALSCTYDTEIAKNGNLYEVKISGIPAHKLNEDITLSVGGLELQCDPIGYYGKNAENSGDADLYNVMNALAAYAACAEDYR